MTAPITINLITIHPDHNAPVLKGLERIMQVATELKAALDALTARTAKIGDETRALLAKVNDLTTALANAGNTTPEVDAALAALQAQVGIVDELVPDAPPPAAGAGTGAGGSEPSGTAPGFAVGGTPTGG